MTRLKFKTYCDTSFLVSLYLRDTNTFKALAWIRRLSEPVILTSLQHYELINAMHLCEFRKQISSSQLRQSKADFNQDLSSGVYANSPLIWNEVFSRAIMISQHLSSRHGYRTIDALHIAAALELKCTRFWSFDRKQVKCAKAAGLNCA